MLRPSHKMSHSHPIICCFRVLKKIKVTISHPLFNTPSLSAFSGPSLPVCPFNLTLPLSPSSILTSFFLSLSLSAQCCVWWIDLQPLFLSVIHLVVHPLSHKPPHAHGMWILLSDHPLTHTHTYALAPSLLNDSSMYLLTLLTSVYYVSLWLKSNLTPDWKPVFVVPSLVKSFKLVSPLPTPRITDG